MRNTYAPGSHDWFVPNTLLHLNTNLFNYISLLYTYFINYISLLPIAICPLPMPSLCLAWMHTASAGCIRLPNALGRRMHSAADAFGGPPGVAGRGAGGVGPRRGARGRGGEPPRVGRRMHRPPNAFGGRMHSAADAFGGSPGVAPPPAPGPSAGPHPPGPNLRPGNRQQATN